MCEYTEKKLMMHFHSAISFIYTSDLPDFRKIVEGSLGHLNSVVQSDHMRLIVDPQN